MLYAGEPLPHFNEVDECAGLDALVTNRVWKALGLPPETTLHDLRCGEEYQRRVRLGVRDFRRGAAGASRRRLRRSGERASAADVFPAWAAAR